MEKFLFMYCQKIIVFSEDGASILLAKRQGEQDYDGVYTFIGGKMERSDKTLLDALRREKTEEVGAKLKLDICLTVNRTIEFTRKDGHRVILPHYIARSRGGEVVLNEEYSDYAWVPVEKLASFSPLIDNIPDFVAWAQRMLPTLTDDDWTSM